MKVVVDRNRCVGNAVCMITAPEIFEVRDEDNLAHVLQENPPEQLRAKVEEAVRNCPTRAIFLEQDSERE